MDFEEYKERNGCAIITQAFYSLCFHVSLTKHTPIFSSLSQMFPLVVLLGLNPVLLERSYCCFCLHNFLRGPNRIPSWCGEHHKVVQHQSMAFKHNIVTEKHRKSELGSLKIINHNTILE